MLGRDGIRDAAPPGDGSPPQSTAGTERILFVSDDEQLRVLVCELLVARGYAGVIGVDSLTALSTISQLADCDVAIVDTTVSRADAVRAFRKLKKSGNASIVVITAKENGAGSADLAADADVLLAKPFDPRELVLIIRGMLHGRTRGASQSSGPLSVGPVTLHTLLNTATVAAREIELTGVETRILEELLLNAGNPVTRDRLTRFGLRRAWSPFHRCLDTHINRLRRKIGCNHRGHTPIRTIRGIGYLMLAVWEPNL